MAGITSHNSSTESVQRIHFSPGFRVIHATQFSLLKRINDISQAAFEDADLLQVCVGCGSHTVAKPLYEGTNSLVYD